MKINKQCYLYAFLIFAFLSLSFSYLDCEAIIRIMLRTTFLVLAFASYITYFLLKNNKTE